MRLICVVKICLSTISLTNNSNELTAIKETSKYSVKSSDYLTDDDEKNQEIVNDLEKGLYRKRMLSYGGLLKQKHKILGSVAKLKLYYKFNFATEPVLLS